MGTAELERIEKKIYKIQSEIARCRRKLKKLEIQKMEQEYRRSIRLDGTGNAAGSIDEEKSYMQEVSAGILKRMEQMGMVRRKD